MALAGFGRKMPIKPDTIVLVHGLWMTPLSWEHWTQRFTEKGFKVIAPTWPGMDRPIEDIRQNPDELAGLGVTEIVDHYETVIRGLDKPPIIMGHSFGGLITQILLDRGWGAAGVAIASAPVKGILLLPFSSIRVAWPALKNPANTNKAHALTPEQFHYAFGNLLSEEESQAVYERYAIPGPDHVLFQASFANFNPHAATTVNFHNDTRAPLLLVAGDHDHIAPPSVAHMNYKLYKHSEAITDYKEFEGHSHYILGEKGWDAVADYCLGWSLENAR